ncbi:hypothetical protein AB4343_02305 [Vibrio breoganii]|uniref:Uncharacterized protein n=1 Tax=Vibrio breoganii TaxID=553239 RepID=A0AAP8SYF7_9VIBR|nr:hypothetical protein [Vibrio breoganii]PMP17056.1 hypothetical protein BCS93_00225 [Vibrio breoganii]
MLTYFIFFILLGAAISRLFGNKEHQLIIAGVIGILWVFQWGFFWGVITAIEIAAGASICDSIFGMKKKIIKVSFK